MSLIWSLLADLAYGGAVLGLLYAFKTLCLDKLPDGPAQ
jgi:hypothetical protein